MFYSCGRAVSPALLTENKELAQAFISGTSVENHLAVESVGYFLVLQSVPLVLTSIFVEGL